MSLRATLRRPLALAALAAVVLAGAATAATPARAGLGEDCVRIRELAETASVGVGLVVLDLASGERCTFRAGTTFRSASLYKLPVMAEAFGQIAAGALDPGDRLALESRHYVDVPHTDPGETVIVTVEAAIQAMIQWSDNPTAVALHERLTDAAVVDHARRLGMDGTVLETRYETTPADIALFFERLYDGAIVSARASARMHDLLRGQRVRRLLPQGLPEGVPIAHKTGSLPSWEHDAGIVEAAGGDYVIVVLTRHGGDVAASYSLIRELSALVYEGFAGAEREGETARLPTALATPEPAPEPAAVAAAPALAPPLGRTPAPAATAAPTATPAATPIASPEASPAAPTAAPTAREAGLQWWQRPGGRALIVALAGTLPALSLLAGARMLRSGG